MPLEENAFKRSSLKNEALHIAILANALAGNSNANMAYSKNEALDILTKKLETFSAFTGRSRLSRQDQIAYWSLYGLLEVLETSYPEKLELIQSCKHQLESLSSYINVEELTNHDSVEELFFIPFLKSQEYRETFLTE